MSAIPLDQVSPPGGPLSLPFPAELVEAIAQRAAEIVLARAEVGNQGSGGWLDARAAAEYLGLPSVDQLHKLTASRALPFTQERPGAKCYFRRVDLDEYREQFLRGGPPLA